MFLHSHVESTNTTDRERILHALVIALRSAATRLCPGEDDGHVALYNKPKIGDLVIGVTSAQIGVVVERPTDEHGDGWMIRPVGLDKVERWDNEMFSVIRGLRSHDLLIGRQAAFWALLRHKCDCIMVSALTYRGRKFIDGKWSTAVMTTSVELRVCDVTFDGACVQVTYRVKFEDARVSVPIESWRQRWSAKRLRATLTAALEGATCPEEVQS